MKPLEPQPHAVPAPSVPKPDSGSDLDEQQSQRLWQLLHALPNLEQEGMRALSGVSEIPALQAIGAAAGAGGTPGHTRERDEQDGDVTAALASAAHLLATTIQQLGVHRYAATEHAPPPPPAADQAWTMRLVDVDATGGTASVNVVHPLLGDIGLDVELSQGSARVVATVPNDYGARILLEGQAMLAERLLRQGVTLAALDVLVRRKRKRKNTQPARKRGRKEDR